MVRIFKDDGTRIIGGIIASTIEQIKLLGHIGEEVLKKFNAFFLLIFLVFLKVPAIGLVDIEDPFLFIKFSGEQLIIE